MLYRVDGAGGPEEVRTLSRNWPVEMKPYVRSPVNVKLVTTAPAEVGR